MEAEKIESTKPIINKKFDLDLKYGQIREKALAKILGDSKIEVKTERKFWKKTGNIAIEFESFGKPSGIETTEANYWVQILADGDGFYTMLIFSVDNLKSIVKNFEANIKNVGDAKASKVYLIPLKDIFDKEIYNNDNN